MLRSLNPASVGVCLPSVVPNTEADLPFPYKSTKPDWWFNITEIVDFMLTISCCVVAGYQRTLLRLFSGYTTVKTDAAGTCETKKFPNQNDDNCSLTTLKNSNLYIYYNSQPS
jgi:hypothetical protein